MSRNEGRVHMNNKIIKTKSIFIVVSATILLTSMPVHAAEHDWSTPDIHTEKQDTSLKVIPTTLKDLFDADYYAFQYPDLALSLGYDKEKLYEHFLKYGIKEGRVCSRYFDISKYCAMYSDLVSVYGDNLDLYVQHFFTIGVYEGRSCGIEAADKVYSNAVANNLPINSVFSLIQNQNSQTENLINVSSTGVISDSSGNILIPWEVISREPYLTLDTLRERCGDNLIIVTDVDGNITFVGGHFSSVHVTDSESAKESLHTMMQLLDFPEDTRILEFAYSGVDTDKNTYYRFVANTLDGVRIDQSSITVSVGTNGEVLSVSNTSPNRWNQEPVNYKDSIINAIEYFKGRGYNFLLDEFRYAYDNQYSGSYWYNYYQDSKSGEIKCLYLYVQNERIYYGLDTVAESLEAFKPDKYRGQYGYILDKDVVVVYKEFVDYYGNIVSLPCVEKNGKWYLYDKDKHILGIDKSSELFFDKEYFEFVNLYKTNPELVENSFKAACESNNTDYLTNKIGLAIYIYAFETIQNELSNDTTRGILENKDKLLLIQYCGQPGYPNLAANLGIETSSIEIYNSLFATQYDAICHELGHSIHYLVSGFLPYSYAQGAVTESYGDILGNLAEMIQEKTSGYCDKENWLVGEANGYTLNYNNGDFSFPKMEGMNDSVFSKYALSMKDNTYTKYGCMCYLRNMSNPADEHASANYKKLSYKGSPSRLGGEYFIENTSENLSNDYGGVHTNSGVLNNVCYNMYQKLHAMDENFGYQQMYNIWLDTLQYNTVDTLYSDIAAYVKQSMINKNYSSEAIDAAMQCFVDANVYDYKPNSVEHIYLTIDKAQSELCDIQVEEELLVEAAYNEETETIPPELSEDTPKEAIDESLAEDVKTTMQETTEPEMAEHEQ